MENELNMIKETRDKAEDDYEYYKEKLKIAKAKYDSYVLLVKFLENKYEPQTKKVE